MNYPTTTAILAGGLIAGTIDIGVASAINQVHPLLLLQAIASGALGRSSYQGGLATSALGLVLQDGMSVIIAALFVLAARRLRVLTDRWILAGLAYGVPIYLVMNFIVYPLSNAVPALHFTVPGVIINVAAMQLFGLIIAGSARLVIGRSGRGVPMPA
jgi:hypothetical protein